MSRLTRKEKVALAASSVAASGGSAILAASTAAESGLLLVIGLVAVAAGTVKGARTLTAYVDSHNGSGAFDRKRAEQLITAELGGKANITEVMLLKGRDTCKLTIATKSGKSFSWYDAPSDDQSLSILAQFISEMGLGANGVIFTRLKRLRRGDAITLRSPG